MSATRKIVAFAFGFLILFNGIAEPQTCNCSTGQFACTNCLLWISCDGHHAQYCGELTGASCSNAGQCAMACVKRSVYLQSICQGDYRIVYDSLCCRM